MSAKIKPAKIQSNEWFAFKLIDIKASKMINLPKKMNFASCFISLFIIFLKYVPINMPREDSMDNNINLNFILSLKNYSKIIS